jgi:hypothetical protein
MPLLPTASVVTFVALKGGRSSRELGAQLLCEIVL